MLKANNIHFSSNEVKDLHHTRVRKRCPPQTSIGYGDSHGWMPVSHLCWSKPAYDENTKPSTQSNGSSSDPRHGRQNCKQIIYILYMQTTSDLTSHSQIRRLSTHSRPTTWALTTSSRKHFSQGRRPRRHPQNARCPQPPRTVED